MVNGAIRHLLLDSPPSANHSVIRAYFSPTPNPLQDRLVDAAHALKLEAHAFGVWNPVLVQNLQPERTSYVQLTAIWSPATVKFRSPSSATVSTPHGDFKLKNSHSFMFQPPTDPLLPLYKMSPDHLLPPLCDSPHFNPTPPIQNGGQFSSTTPHWPQNCLSAAHKYTFVSRPQGMELHWRGATSGNSHINYPVGIPRWI